jgi:hypothetical protein
MWCGYWGGDGGNMERMACCDLATPSDSGGLDTRGSKGCRKGDDDDDGDLAHGSLTLCPQLTYYRRAVPQLRAFSRGNPA